MARCFLIGKQQERSSISEAVPVVFISSYVVLTVGFVKRDLGPGLTQVCNVSWWYYRGVINMNGRLNIPSFSIPSIFYSLSAEPILLRGFIKGKLNLVLRFHLMLSDWHHVFNTWSSVLCAYTDSSGWIAEERKSSAVTERSACSCFVPDRLLHSAQLTLQQGSAAGKMQHAHTISSGCHGRSGEKLHLPPTFLSSL